MSNLWLKASEKGGKSKTEIILLYLERSGMATTQEIADALHCSANTARKWLYRMEKSGLVKYRTHYYHAGVYLLRWSLVS